MNYRFYITALSSRIEVFPLNFRQTTLIDERVSVAQVRTSFSNTLRFTDNNGSDDFSLFYLIEATTPCERLILEIEQKDSGADTYHEYWTGYFSTSDGVFDLDNCTYDITPKPYDDYINFDLYGEQQHNILTVVPTTVTAKTYEYDYTRCRWLIDVIEYLVESIEPTATVVSWFLNNATNPVLGGVNQYQHLMIAQKSDIKRPLSSNPATVGMMSFKEMMEILRMYNLYWHYDGTTFRIEHYDFWEGGAGLDLTAEPMAVRMNKYSYVKNDMPKYEKFAFMEGGDFGYVEHTISYDSDCVDAKATASYSNKVTTDLSYIQTCAADPDLVSNISDDGWVILATEYDGTDYRVYYGTAYGSAFGSYNYPNSWGDLLRSFFIHGRVLLTGYIQGIAYDFISVRRTKQQELKAVVCYEDNYDARDYITTELGETWFGGQKAYVSRASRHPDGLIEFTLVYGEDKNTEVELPERTKNLNIRIDAPSYTEIISILSEPNLVDTYYWIFWNGSAVGEVCQEIMIPAGTVYQVDLADLAEPFASIKFNLEDSSLDGWVIVYNNNDPIVATDPGDCGVPPAPPAVPAATTMIGASQLSTCDPIHVTWNASAGATYYKLYRKPDNSLADNWVLVDNVMTTEYDDYWAGSQDRIQFYYKVQCCSGGGCSADSDEKTVIALC